MSNHYEAATEQKSLTFAWSFLFQFGILWCIYIGNRYTPATKFPWFINLISQINIYVPQAKQFSLF